jgi:rhamnosyltransferase
LVLLAAFNGSRWIGEQIDSILRQAQVDLDLLVGDDGSSDGTLDELKKYAADRRVQLAPPASPSGSAAQNFFRLFRHAAAQDYAFVALSDQDDIWHEQKLIRACSALTDSGASGYSCAVTAMEKGRPKGVLKQVDSITESDFLFEGAGQGCTFVLTASLYGRVRTFLMTHPAEAQLVYYHDWSIYALSRLWKLRWVFDPQPMMLYRQHEANDTGARSSAAGILWRLANIKSGWYLRQLSAISQLCFAVAPADPVIVEWMELLALPRGITRRYRMFRFCARGGRRRRIDRAVLLSAVVAGWV